MRIIKTHQKRLQNPKNIEFYKKILLHNDQEPKEEAAQTDEEPIKECRMMAQKTREQNYQRN